MAVTRESAVNHVSLSKICQDSVLRLITIQRSSCEIHFLMILVDRSNAEAFCVFLLFTRGLMDFQNPKPSLEPLGQCLEHGSWTFGVTTRKRDPLLRKGHLGLTVRRCL